MASSISTFSTGFQSQSGSEGKNSAAVGSSRDGSATLSPDSGVDSTQLSQFAVFLSGLRSLEKSDPSAFKAVLLAAGASLSDEAQGASSEGSVATANMLAALEGDCTDASHVAGASNPGAASTGGSDPSETADSIG